VNRDYGLGRLPSPPDRRDYLMADAVRELEAAPRPVKHWASRRVLDQGREPECVGFAWAHWGISTPVEDPWTNLMGRAIYRDCKLLDGNSEPGSTVRSGAKAMLKRGRIKTYFFAASVDEALDFVARFGPVVFGSVWTEGMFKPSLFGHIIRPTGAVAGGHAYLIDGVERLYARIHQSWGVEWGDGGECRIRISHLKEIFAAGGEACAATEKALPIGGK